MECGAKRVRQIPVFGHGTYYLLFISNVDVVRINLLSCSSTRSKDEKLLGEALKGSYVYFWVIILVHRLK